MIWLKHTTCFKIIPGHGGVCLHPSTQEAGAGRALWVLGEHLSIYQVQDQPELHSETLSQSHLKSCKSLLFHLANKKNGLACCCCFGGILLSGTRKVTLQGWGTQGVPAQGLWAPYRKYMASSAWGIYFPPLRVTKDNTIVYHVWGVCWTILTKNSKGDFQRLMLGYLIDGLMALGGNSFSTDGKISLKLYMCVYTLIYK